MWARKEAEWKGDGGELPDTREKHVCPGNRAEVAEGQDLL